jgi:flagellar motor switch/type III secretory pathway protein FliN
MDGRDVMTLATTTTVRGNDAAPAPRARERTPDVNRWIDMLDAELRAADTPASDDLTAVPVTIEFGRCTLDAAAATLQAGDSLRLDELADEPLHVLDSGRPIARGELVVVDGHWGVRIVELLMLLVALFATAAAPCRADERPRERSSSVLFDNEPDELLETPFGPTRQKRSSQADAIWSENERPSTQRTATDAARLVNSESVSTPLTPRSSKASRDEATVRPSGWSATVWPLLLIAGLVAAGAKWLKTRSPESTKRLPTEAFEVLGRQAVDARTTVLLARSGTKLLLLSLSPHGLRTLTEVTDPVEVDCLAGLCRATKREQPLVETFRSLLRKPAGTNAAPRASSDATTLRSLDNRFANRAMTSPTASVPFTETQP